MSTEDIWLIHIKCVSNCCPVLFGLTITVTKINALFSMAKGLYLLVWFVFSGKVKPGALWAPGKTITFGSLKHKQN